MSFKVVNQWYILLMKPSVHIFQLIFIEGKCVCVCVYWSIYIYSYTYVCLQYIYLSIYLQKLMEKNLQELMTGTNMTRDLLQCKSVYIFHPVYHLPERKYACLLRKVIINLSSTNCMIWGITHVCSTNDAFQIHELY